MLPYVYGWDWLKPVMVVAVSSRDRPHCVGDGPRPGPGRLSLAFASFTDICQRNQTVVADIHRDDGDGGRHGTGRARGAEPGG